MIDGLLDLLNTLPEILERLQADLDRHVMPLKQARLTHRRASAGTFELPGLDDSKTLETIAAKGWKLRIGPPRMSSQDFLFCLVFRDYLDDV